MTIENHPALHYVMVLLFYHMGLLANVLAGAHLSTQSSVNTISSLKQYFALRWIPVGIRWLLSICLFLFVWENNSVMNLERFMPNFAAHVGAAGIIGWFSDSFWDKVTGILLPGLQKAMPVVPTAGPPGA